MTLLLHKIHCVNLLTGVHEITTKISLFCISAKMKFMLVTLSKMADLTWLSKLICIIICLQMKESQTILVKNYFQFQGQNYISHREIKIWGTDKEVLAENEKQKVYDNQRIICAVCWSYWKPNYRYCFPSISLNVISCERRAAFSVELLNAPASKRQWNETPCN